MGLNYSIQSFIKKENFKKSLEWLLENTKNSHQQLIIVDNEILKINGTHFRLDDYDSGYEIPPDKVIPSDFEYIYFSNSLIFSMDPEIVSSFASHFKKMDLEDLNQFYEDFNSSYIGNGKLSIGYFDCSIQTLKNNPDVYQLDFTAVTSDMSLMLEKSASVKKWIHEFSQASESIISLINCEFLPCEILYYKGNKLSISYNYEIELSSLNSVQNVTTDFFRLVYDIEILPSSEKYFQIDRINIVEDHNYSVFIKDNKFYIQIEMGHNKTIELNENQIVRFKKEGKQFTDALFEKWLKKSFTNIE